jgi:hypothetical protein
MLQEEEMNHRPHQRHRARRTDDPRPAGQASRAQAAMIRMNYVEHVVNAQILFSKQYPLRGRRQPPALFHRLCTSDEGCDAKKVRICINLQLTFRREVFILKPSRSFLQDRSYEYEPQLLFCIRLLLYYAAIVRLICDAKKSSDIGFVSCGTG